MGSAFLQLIDYEQRAKKSLKRESFLDDLKNTESFLVVLAGDVHYAFPIETVSDVVALHDIAEVPAVDKIILGIMNIKGQPFTIVGLEALLKNQKPSGRDKQVVILSDEDWMTGFVVQQTLGIRHVKKAITCEFTAQEKEEFAYAERKIECTGITRCFVLSPEKILHLKLSELKRGV